MNFKKWLENTTGLAISTRQEYDSGLNRAVKRTPVKFKRNKMQDKLDKDFGMQAVQEATDLSDKGAGIFFTDTESVLLLKRSKDSNHGETWCLPRGHAKEGETPLQTALREAKEEVGGAKGTNLGHLVRDGWWTTFFFLTSPFKCKLNDEHTQWKWVAFDELENYPLLPDLKTDLPDYFLKLKELLSK